MVVANRSEDQHQQMDEQTLCKEEIGAASSPLVRVVKFEKDASSTCVKAPVKS